MAKNSIRAKSGGVVNTGQINGSISTNVSGNEPSSSVEGDKPQRLSPGKIALISAIITGLATMISGALIASSNWFTK